jgi:hypothetical protein
VCKSPLNCFGFSVYCDHYNQGAIPTSDGSLFVRVSLGDVRASQYYTVLEWNRASNIVHISHRCMISNKGALST